MTNICKIIFLFAWNILQITVIDASTKMLLAQTVASTNIAATSRDKSTVHFRGPIVQNTGPKAQVDGKTPKKTSSTPAVNINPTPFDKDKTASVRMSDISMEKAFRLASIKNHRVNVTPALENIVPTEQNSNISPSTNFDKILTSTRSWEYPYDKTVLPAIRSSASPSSETTVNANYDRNKGVDKITGPSSVKYNLPWTLFSTTGFETSSWVTLSTPSMEINPNCSGLIVDVKRKITYCTNIWGKMYRSIPVDSTTQAAVTDPGKDFGEILVDKQDLPHLDTSVTINVHAPLIALQMFCPESANCPVAKIDSATGNPCCIPCDCSEGCIHSYTCCLNKNHTITSQQTIGNVIEKCVKTYIGDPSQNIGLQSTSMFILIQGCPEENNKVIDSVTEVKCINPTENFLDEIVPFYSRITNKSYRNIHCARCNIDHEVGFYWESYFSCTSLDCFDSVLKKSIGMTRALSDWFSEIAGGIIYWKPPTNDIRKCAAQENMISTCNVNNKYSTMLKNLCSLYHAPVRGRYGVYKNWYCLLCNDLGDNSVWSCQRKESEMFTAEILLDKILNNTITVPAEMKNVSFECRNGLHFDISLNECVRKSCAITEVNVNGMCFPIMTHVSKVSLDYRLNVAYPVNFIPSMENILNSVRTLSLQPNVVGNCEERILGIDTRGDEIVFRIQLVKNVTELTNIQTEFQTFKQRVDRMNAEAVKEQSLVMVTITEAPLSPVKEGYVSFGVFDDVINKSQCGSQLAMSEIQFCDIIIIDEFTKDFNGIVYNKNVAFMPGEYIANYGSNTEMLGLGKDYPKSISICYDLYVSRMMESKGDTGMTGSDGNTIKNGVPSRQLSDKWLCVFLHLIIVFCNLLFSELNSQKCSARGGHCN